MKKPPEKPEQIIFSVRLDMKERDALEKAAKAEERPAAVVVRRLIREFLRAGEWIK